MPVLAQRAAGMTTALFVSRCPSLDSNLHILTSPHPRIIALGTARNMPYVPRRLAGGRCGV